ncbi:hypothetical protein HYALB_00005199 [Hymenoscyphus albidus]|uniref:Uncharacterized protein n=1 Tax=Hymenoscyphus albidus TaxID=595503 RepID=A0A9N9Q516_9HELO|nr:hypothetical protein HYALB_00005199 [Hymenoscyphus albidus]
MMFSSAKGSSLASRDPSPATTLQPHQEYSGEESDQKQGVTSKEEEILDLDFSDLGVAQVFNHDPRPTFVVKFDTLSEDRFDVVFVNSALTENPKLFTAIERASGPQQSSKDAAATQFRGWLNTIFDTSSTKLPPAIYSDFAWNAFRIQKTWVVVAGNDTIFDRPMDVLSRTSSSNSTSSQATEILSHSKVDIVRSNATNSIETGEASPSFVTPGTPDWTVPFPVGDLSPHIIFTRSVDWAATPLGDMTSWTPEFRQICNLLMANPHPAALFWGEELTVIYNKAYADNVAGDKHPKLMGVGFSTAGAFQELWDHVDTIFNECRTTGKSVAISEQMLPIHRFGFLQETYYTWSLSPLYGGTTKILGMYNAPFETTRQTRAARAFQTLLKLGQDTALAQTVSGFWGKTLLSLESNGFDFPFALIYSVQDEYEQEDDNSSTSSSSDVMKSCILEGSIGVPDGHAAAPSRLDLHRARGGFIPSFRDALRTRQPKLLKIVDGSLSESLLEGIQWRGYGEPCREAIVCPIRPTNSDDVMGFLVFGINPRRRYDEDYQKFVQLLDRQMTTSLASVKLFEEETLRGDTAKENAEAERVRFSKELDLERTRLQRMAEISSVGLFSIGVDGKVLEANDRWYEITGHSRDLTKPMSFVDTLIEECKSAMYTGWKRLTVDRMPWTSELQLKNSWFDPATTEEFDHWVLVAAQPEICIEGELKSVMGTITDITLQKRSEKDAKMRAKLADQLLTREQEAKDLQKRQLEEAEENRRRQNNFIDITSHEMRNPLSAILQCADSITTTLKEALTGNSALDASAIVAFEDAIGSAETITLCAQHQKAIIDDILTISKLDANLLLITPLPVQPVGIVRQTLKMFTAEVQMSSIELNFNIEDSWVDLDANTVMLDYSRLRQILVNLLSNAVKFTKNEAKPRKITISLSAHTAAPPPFPDDFKYFPTEKSCPDVTAGEDWGRGDILYLRFEVNDSGCGLNEEEKKNLFNRYSQASPKTHVKYGGSGLGLFISRQLTELQGGEIGAASKAGVGSVFAFYVKARKAESKDVNNPKEKAIPGSQMLTVPIMQPSISRVSSAPASIPTTTSLDSGPAKWHVLIVEDNLVNQKVLAKGIRKLGCTVHVANHGGEALDLLQQTRYYKGREDDGKELTVILMDLEMPVMDGLTCVRKIRSLQQEGLVTKHLPIIAVTANARQEQVAAAKASGMDDVMPKPFPIRELIPKIETLLNS